jgi:uncharacterized membrane protein
MNTNVKSKSTIPRALAWVAMFLLASFVAAYAAAVLVDPAWRSPIVRDLLAHQNLAALCHFSGGALALLAGALQINARLRTRFRRVHRWTGRVYVGAVLVSGIAGLSMALHSSAGPVARWGFGLLALAWLGCTVAGWRQAVRGDLASHRRWMIRSYALTLAAVTLRLYLPLSMLLGIPFPVAYPAIAWLCWVPNLLLAQWMVRSTAAIGALGTAR